MRYPVLQITRLDERMVNIPEANFEKNSCLFQVCKKSTNIFSEFWLKEKKIIHTHELQQKQVESWASR